MLAKTITLKSNPSTSAPTNSDSVSMKKISFLKRDSFGIAYSSSEENKLQTDIITVKSVKEKNCEFSKSSLINIDEKFSTRKGQRNSSRKKNSKKFLKVLDEDKNEIYIKSILKNNNLNKVTRPVVKLNVTRYQSKIKFVDQVVNLNQPIEEIIVVESYKKYNQEMPVVGSDIHNKKTREQCKCKCLIF